MAMEKHPFSRILPVTDIPPGGREIRIEASEPERQALATSFRLPAIHHLEARLRLQPKPRGVHIDGTVSARVTQTCVVSLDAFDTDIQEPVSIDFTADPDLVGGEIDLRPDAPDPPEPLVDGAVDLGAVAAEFLALALDPYPRKPDADFAGHSDVATEGPFAGLRDRLKKPGPDA